jgi:4-hydroxyphenylpyruvate dioxygenase
MFKHFDDKDIATDFSALMSKVMSSGQGLIKIPINEPAPGKRKSQVQEYLDWHCNTPGVQHLALRTDDELHSIAALRARGVDFLTLPDTYYEQVWNRVNTMLTSHGHQAVKEDHQRVKDLGILVDADDEGYLLQLFTKPLQDRPTLFFEIICRRGSQSFGKGNFKALFEALELEQARRGNL